MRLAAIALAIGLSLVSAVRCAAAAEGRNGESGGGTPGIEPAKDEEVLRLTYSVVHTVVLEKRQATLQKVLALDRNRVVAALAATIPDPERGHHYVSFAANYLPDARLVPVVAARIRASEGALLKDTLTRLQHAPNEFLRGLVPALIEHALDSDYVEKVFAVTPMGGETFYRSVLAETTRLLDQITGGRSGIQPISDSELRAAYDRNAKKAEVQAAWRKWWEEHREEWRTSLEQGKAAEIKPVADEALWKVFQTVLAECTDYEARLKTVQEAIQKDRERALSTVAFYLGQEATRGNALRFVWHLRDSRLVPFVVEAMRRSAGRTLLEAVRTARAWGDRRFLPVLIEHALDSDYEDLEMFPAPRGMAEQYDSVFGQAAVAIHAMTKGWAGSDQYWHKRLPPKEERNALTTQWRKWWAENKAKYEAGVPFEKNPNAPEKPPRPPA
jgi:hypothetical protein